MSDLISRQAAIDACIRVRELRAYDEIEEIKALPSEQKEGEMSDLISKRDVFNAITKSIIQFGSRYTSEQLNMWELFTQLIEELPSTQKKGE